MIEVRMYLYPDELALFSNFMTGLEAERQNDMDAPASSMETEPDGGAREDAPRKIDDGMLEAAITHYYSKNGIAAARAFLAEYGVARITLLPEDKQAEAYSRLMA